MNEVDPEVGVLLPLASVAVLGQGGQGMAVLESWGMPVPERGGNLESLLENAKGDADPEAAETIDSLTTIADLARTAVGWLHVRPVRSTAPASVMLVGRERVLFASLHGPLVEWLVGPRTLVARVLTQGRASVGDGELHVTAFVGDASVGGARIHGNQVDVSARTEPALRDLARRASEGLPQLGEALISLVVEVSDAASESGAS